MRTINFFIFFLINCSIFAQIDTSKYHLIEYNKNFHFKDGIYFNFEQFKNNNPTNKNRIITNLDYDALDFYEKLFEKEIIYMFDDFGVKQQIDIYNLWGFCNNGIVYINWETDFNRIAIIGNICHFIANKTVYNTNYSPYNNYYYDPYATQTSTSQELRQYILNFETGEVYNYNYQNIEIILMSDPELYDEYHDLSRKKRKKLKFVYIRKYNIRNPIFILEEK